MPRSSHLILLLGLPLILGASLPRSGPVPEEKPTDGKQQEEVITSGRSAEKDDPSPAEVPKPEPKPDLPDNTEDQKSAGENQRQPKSADEESLQNEKAPSSTKQRPPKPLENEDPKALRECLAALTELGTKFEKVSAIEDGSACGIRKPVELFEALPGIDVGKAKMRCKTALSLAHWLKDTVQPALDIAMPGRRITSIITGTTYACRRRNGASTGKISEHARGNAIDIVSLRLDDGSEVEMKPRDKDSTMEGAFQRTATAGACLHFTTVLSPGSDAAHQDHLHLDILERKNGYRYCR